MPLNSVSVNVVPTLILRSVCLVGMNMYLSPRLQPVMLFISGANGTSLSLAHYLISCAVYTRAKYKYAIRYCRQQEKQIQADALAQHLSKQNFSSFWHKVSKTVSPSMPNSSKVGQATGPNDICSMWYSHYQSLFTSVGYDRPTVNGIIANVHLRNTDVIKYSTCTEIRDVLATLNNNKSADCYGLCAEHYKLARDLYCNFLALCFNAMFLHGCIPADATQTIICPSVKDKNGDLSDISNYRPIALATVFSKILEHVL